MADEDGPAYLRLMQQVFERAHVAIWICDKDCKIVLWSRGAEDIYGWSAAYQEMFIDETERDSIVACTSQVIERGLEFRNFLAYDRASDGSTRYVLTNCFRVIDPVTHKAYQAEIAVEISDLEIQKDRHRTIREQAIAREARTLDSLERSKDDLLLRTQRAVQELGFTRMQIAHDLDYFRTSASSRTQRQVEKTFQSLHAALDTEFALIEQELEELRSRIRSSSTINQLGEIRQLLDANIAHWGNRLRQTQGQGR